MGGLDDAIAQFQELRKELEVGMPLYASDHKQLMTIVSNLESTVLEQRTILPGTKYLKGLGSDYASHDDAYVNRFIFRTPVMKNEKASKNAHRKIVEKLKKQIQRHIDYPEDTGWLQTAALWCSKKTHKQSKRWTFPCQCLFGQEYIKKHMPVPDDEWEVLEYDPVEHAKYFPPGKYHKSKKFYYNSKKDKGSWSKQTSLPAPCDKCNSTGQVKGNDEGDQYYVEGFVQLCVDFDNFRNGFQSTFSGATEDITSSCTVEDFAEWIDQRVAFRPCWLFLLCGVQIVGGL